MLITVNNFNGKIENGDSYKSLDEYIIQNFPSGRPYEEAHNWFARTQKLIVRNRTNQLKKIGWCKQLYFNGWKVSAQWLINRAKQIITPY